MTESTPLPPLDDDRIDAMEARIVTAHRGERAIRRRRFVGVIGVTAGVLALAAFVGPMVSGGQTSSMSMPAMDAPTEVQPFSDPGSASGSGAITGEESLDSVPEEAAADSARSGVDSREIVTTASATVEVRDVSTALAAVTATADELGGYVESSDTSSTGASTFTDQSFTDQTFTDGSYTDRSVVGYGSAYISIRVPADRLSEAQESLEEVGTVTASSTNRQDVTTQAVDLRARIGAAQTSVDRLSALIAQAESVADLLTAESALAERQAELESYQQQLTALEGQVSLSSLTVSLVPRTAVTTAEPTGVLDGLIAGWNALIAAANGLLIGLGFLLPWLVVAAAVTALVIGIRRLRRRRATRR